ncbi:hypothetical protein JIN84_15670 [Luteolibacter yonseiensis]|uniref:Transmembrane protein n=1 Tax=Luteolibacter yonseiensis TaxID=1144680 RepID=A0A934R4Z7_9BACT|nr:hypothetical protein [Luteolibacter yonseiensis]MBK1817062.1 hypothetical protein [Luteolibacter yonseiensis]
MEPIATYSEKRFDGRRVFNLLPDSVLISGSTTFRAEFQCRVPLKGLDQHYDTIWLRNPLFGAGLGLFGVSLLVNVTLISGFHMDWASKPPILTACAGMWGFALSLATLRKVEFVCFRSLAGASGLDLARSGPQKEKLDTFVASLIRQIEESNRNDPAK